MDGQRESEQADEMLGQALKGLLGGFSAGNGITRQARAIQVPWIGPDDSLISRELLAACATAHDGDILVVASKVVALAEGRYIVTASAPPPLTLDGLEALRKALLAAGSAGDDHDMVMLDHVADSDMWTVSVLDPNATAARLAATLHAQADVRLDVVISDSGAGVLKGRMLIGCTTYVATPIGATAGLSLLQAQRCAVVAEVARNSSDRSPFVLIHSDLDIRRRSRLGEPRYAGYLDARSEDPYTIPAG